MTSLLDRDATPEDFDAELDLPRPGVWAVEENADLRALTQDETDLLIRRELLATAAPTERRALRAAVGGHVELPPWPANVARAQRGGIDSDPLVRVLARRTWGTRDRQWFERRGMRSGDRVHVLDMDNLAEWAAESPVRTIVATAWRHEIAIGEVVEDARPGELVYARLDEAPLIALFGRRAVEDGFTVRCRASDRLREPPTSGEWVEPCVSADALRARCGFRAF